MPQKLCVFGAGKLGAKLANVLTHAGIPFLFADNSPEKQSAGYMGMQVLGPNELRDNKDDYFIVVACSTANSRNVERQLQSLGLNAGTDFVGFGHYMNQVLPKLIFERTGRTFMPLCQISLTERCTLRCRKCAHGCYATDPSSPDLALEEVYKSADSFFSHIDMIEEFVLIGGEPLLFKDLDKAIEYIGEKYRAQIMTFSITTNGTLVPTDSVLKACKKHGVLFLISNYAKTLPWIKERHRKLTEALESYGIAYSLGAEETEWMDYGFESVDRRASPADLKKVFSACRTPCHEVRGNRLYYCVMARSVSENLHFNVGRDDYLDLGSLHENEGRAVLVKFIMGDFAKGYLDMCNHCHGAESVQFPIPAADQVENNGGM